MVTGNVVYPSKKGFVVYLLLLVIAGLVCSNIIAGKYWGGLFSGVILLILVLPMVFNTKYTIDNDTTLRVTCGYFVNIVMDIAAIKKIETTKSILSSPALSMDRLEVFYNKFDSVIISPDNKKDFVARLQNINPAIEYINHNN